MSAPQKISVTFVMPFCVKRIYLTIVSNDQDFLLICA